MHILLNEEKCKQKLNLSDNNIIISVIVRESKTISGYLYEEHDMEKIQSLFTTYLENSKWIYQFDERRKNETPLDQWGQDLNGDVLHYQKLFRQNTKVFRKIMELLDMELDDELAEILFQCVKSVYVEIDDGNLCLPFFEKLLSYYLDRRNYDRVFIIYSYLDYIHNAVLVYNFPTVERNFHYSDTALIYADHYGELKTFEGRYRCFVNFHNMIVTTTDNNCISIDQGFQYYDRFLQLWNSDQVTQEDRDSETFQKFWDLLHRRIIGLEIHMPQASLENRERFYELTDAYYEKELAEVEDESFVDVLLYSAKLRSQILKGEKTLLENFDELVDFFRKTFERINDSSETKEQEIFDVCRACIAITKWSKQDIPREKVNQVVNNILTMIETKWKKMKYIHSKVMDDLLFDLINVIFEMPFEGSEKERYAFDFGIRRQVHTFSNAVVVGKIATAIFEACFEKNPELFASVADMKEEELYEFVEKSAAFHNIGNIDYSILRRQFNRALTEEEKEFMKQHTKIGAKMVENVPEMKKYRDVMLYHHKYYDGNGGYPEDADAKDSPYKAVIDLIAIAEFIDEYTNPMLMETFQSRDFKQCLKELKKGAGTRFHPNMVEILLGSAELIKKIETIITEGRMQLLYSFFHSFDLSSDEEDNELYLEETLKMISEAGSEESLAEIVPRIDRLFLIAEHSHSSLFIGKVYFAAARFYENKRQDVRVTNYALHAISLLTENRAYLYISKLYNTLGLQALYNDDLSDSVKYFLLCADYAQKVEQLYGVGVAHWNIFTIFFIMHHYEKSLAYLEKSEPVFGESVMNRCYILCYRGFCYYKLSMVDELEELKEQLTVFMEDEKEYPAFVTDIFLAYYYFSKGQNKQAECYLKSFEKSDSFIGGELNDWMELRLYYELLASRGDHERLLKSLAYEIGISEEKKFPFHICQELLQKAISSAKVLKQTQLVTEYEVKLEQVHDKKEQKKLEMVLEAERSSGDNIAFQEKQEELLNDNKRLKEGLKNAEDVNEAKNVFLTSMSHEIRTPINAVLGLDEMILRETSEEHVKKYALEIQNAGKALLGIVNDIIDFTKLEAGKMELVSEEYTLKDMIRELENMISGRAEQKQLRLVVKANTEMPAKLYGDDLRIKQVIMNLLSNAVKFTEKGIITFAWDYEKKNEDTILLKVLVEDTGIGMKPEDIEKLSKPFERFDMKRNNTIEGNGLGINIVTNLLKQMNSKLVVHSTYGLGSSFSFVLEQKVVDWSQMGDVSEKNGLQNQKRKGPLFVAPDVKILAVDDTAVNLAVVKGLLKRNQVKLTLVKSGKECLEVCSKETFHVILMDHRMPEMDGVEALHRLRDKEGLNQSTPVIALTANAISGAYEYYKNEGFDELVIKPVNGQELEEKILAFLPKELVSQ